MSNQGKAQGKKTKIKLTLDIPPSVNHCYVNVRGHGRFLTKQAADWKEKAGWLAMEERCRQRWQVPDKGVKVVVALWAYWGDQRKHDMNNLHKLLCDALEGVLYVNDQYVLVRDMDFDLDRDNPRIEVVVFEKGEEE